MIVTQTQRFVYLLLALTFATIWTSVLLNVYALEIFLILIIIEFLVLVGLTKPPLVTAMWTKNVTVFIVIRVIVYALKLYQRTMRFCSSARSITRKSAF